MGNSPSSVPYAAQIAYLNITAVCNSTFVDANGNPFQGAPFQQLLGVAVTAPLLSNSRFNYTDIQVTSPGGYSVFGLTAVATATFSTNANPATFQLQSSQFVQDQFPPINIPVTGVTTSPSIAIGSAPAQLSLTKFEIYAYNADVSSRVNCIPNPNIIATTGNGQSLASSSAPANGFLSTPGTPPDSVTNIANLPLSCSSGASYGLIVGGTVPASIKSGSQFLVNVVNIFFNFMSIGSNTAYALTLGRTPSGDNVIGLSAQLTGATLTETDIAREFIASDPSTSNPISGAAYTDGSPRNITLALPFRGSLSKNLTSSSGTFSASLTNLQGTLNTNSDARFVGCKIGSNTLLSVPAV